MSTTKQNVYKFKIDEQRSEELQDAGAMAATMQTAMTQFLDAHALDPDDAAVTSPSCTSFKRQMADAQKEFDKKKRELEMKYFDPEVDQPYVMKWSLDYATCIVTVTMRAGHTLTGIGIDVMEA